MDALGDLVARDRRESEPLVYSAASQPYSAEKFCTDAWKAGNLFSYHGVGPGRPVAIADDPQPQALLAFFGAALLGSSARFGFPPTEDARLAVGPADAVEPLAAPPGQKRMAFAEKPDDPEIIHFERAVWSENPTMPPDPVDPHSTVLVTENGEYDHADLLGAGEAVVDAEALTDEDAVAVRSSLTDPGTIVAGVLAPLSVGAELVLPGSDRTGSVAVGDADAPEDRVVDPATARPDA